MGEIRDSRMHMIVFMSSESWRGLVSAVDGWGKSGVYENRVCMCVCDRECPSQHMPISFFLPVVSHRYSFPSRRWYWPSGIVSPLFLSLHWQWSTNHLLIFFLFILHK